MMEQEEKKSESEPQSKKAVDALVKQVERLKQQLQRLQVPQKLRLGKYLTEFFAKKYPPLPPTVIFRPIPEGAEVLENYDIQPDYSSITIASLPELGGGKSYFINEIQITEAEQLVLRRLGDIISREIEPPPAGVDPRVHLANEAGRLATKYGYSKKMTETTWARILYYLQRDFLGFGHIHAIMNDPLIEDVSVNGVGLPVYVWHRKYESMPTNLTFTDEGTLDNLIVKLTHLSSKHISTAFPILDAMLPGKDRLAATFRREVSPKGGSFTIRRFREEPFSIIDLIELGTINEEIAAYFWMLIENRMTIAVIGGTGAGKTSTLNALASLVKPQMKIVTVEEIPELNIPHENWVQLVSRESYGLGTIKTGQVTLFDLVKTSLRYRPDYIVVGEIRGEEAFVLFQALATGHGGLTTLHAESLDYTIKRLTSPPMNVAEAYVPLINVASMVERVQLPSAKGNISFGRRLKSVVEIAEIDKHSTIATWDPVNDRFKTDFKNSIQLRKIADRNGLEFENILEEMERRINFLDDLKAKGIRKNVDMAKLITNYYLEENGKPSSQQKEKPAKSKSTGG